MAGLTNEAIRCLALAYALTPQEVHRALMWASTAKGAAAARARIGPQMRRRPVERRAQWDFAKHPEPLDGRTWCEQCDRRVDPREAAACVSPWCKGKAAELSTQKETNHV